jgi:hypothetical protein
MEFGLRLSTGHLQERTIWIADAHRGDGRRFVVRADEKLTAFMELESAICECIRASPMHDGGQWHSVELWPRAVSE